MRHVMDRWVGTKSNISLCLLAVAALLPACTALPNAGPTASRIEASTADGAREFEIFHVDNDTLVALYSYVPTTLRETFGNSAPAPVQRIAVGDSVEISIWEAATGGLFNPSEVIALGSRAEKLPVQVVDKSGNVTVPYAGQVKAAGLTTADFARSVESRLSGLAIQPQVLTTVVESAASTATVAGDVSNAGRIKLNIKGDRLVEVIAQAGGAKGPAHQTVVRLTRGDQTAKVSLDTILEIPSENIFIRPGDTIYVSREPPTFTALGAVSKRGELEITQDPMTLTQAIGAAGGLDDKLADSSGVFVFRFEDPEVVRLLRPDSHLLDENFIVPVIYRVSFRAPIGYFYAKAFQVRSGDIVYVAAAESVEFAKFLRLVRDVAVTGRVVSGATIGVVD